MENCKKLTGQSKNSTPQVIIEGMVHHTKHLQMANALNRSYIQKIRKLTQNMQPTATNPLDSYRKSVGQVDHTFTFKQISLGELRSTLSKIKNLQLNGY